MVSALEKKNPETLFNVYTGVFFVYFTLSSLPVLLCYLTCWYCYSLSTLVITSLNNVEVKSNCFHRVIAKEYSYCIQNFSTNVLVVFRSCTQQKVTIGQNVYLMNRPVNV